MYERIGPPLIEDVYEHHGVAVRFRFREPKEDRQHLVVVFAGVQPGKHDFYGFDGRALDNVKGAVLWIKDSFDGSNAYYMCAGMDFKIERAVSALIDSTLESLELTRADCTLLGGSKGGSAALHLGLKYGYGNIVASVPQSRVGTYTREKVRDAFAYMAEADADASEEALNEYIPQLVAAPKSRSTNVYIISSEADPEFKTHIEPLLNDFSTYENFNLLLSDSTLVTAHPDVTPYNVPFILSTLYALCEGLTPRFGLVRNGNGKRDRKFAPSYFARKHAKPEPIARFHWVQMRDDKLSFRAYAAVRGEAAAEAPSVRPKLLAIRASEKYAFELDAIEDKTLNAKLYRKYFCNYLWAGLKPPSGGDLSLRSLPVGDFELAASFVSESGSHQTSLPGKDTQSATGIFGGHAYHLDSTRARTRITKLSLDGQAPDDGVFRIKSLETDGAKLNIEGVFAVPREEMRTWNDGAYALTLRNETTVVSFALGANRDSTSNLPPLNFAPEAFAWANFCTVGRRGVDLGSLADGRYECFVSFVKEGRAYTGTERFSLMVERGSAVLDIALADVN